METKHIIALIVLAALSCGSILATTFSKRARDLAFLAMICLSIFTESFDVNFFGEYWYRGTSRGIGVSLTDILAWAILISTALTPRYPKRRWFWPASTGLLLMYFGYCVFATVHANGDEARRMCAEKLGKQYNQDFSKLVSKYALAGTPEECQKRLKEYIDAGATMVILPSACRPEHNDENLRLLAKEVVPAFR